jgi:hypothetical protein
VYGVKAKQCIQVEKTGCGVSNMEKITKLSILGKTQSVIFRFILVQISEI